MRKLTIMKNAILALAVSGSLSVNASPLFIENLREEMPELSMPVTTPQLQKHLEIADSEPRSRSDLIGLIKSHRGFDWADLSTASRQHIMFKKGSYKLTNQEVEKVRQFLEGRAEGKKVIVFGFADEEGSYELNKALSQKRAEAIEKFIDAESLDAVFLSSVDWPGDPENARRVDIVIY